MDIRQADKADFDAILAIYKSIDFHLSRYQRFRIYEKDIRQAWNAKYPLWVVQKVKAMVQKSCNLCRKICAVTE